MKVINGAPTRREAAAIEAAARRLEARSDALRGPSWKARKRKRSDKAKRDGAPSTATDKRRRRAF